MSEAQLVPLMKELVAAQLVVEESADEFAFRHALTREAAYSSLLRRERRALHRQVGEALEQTFAGALDAYLADLAYQYHAAEEWDKALDYSRRAGEQSLRLYAPHEAIQHLTRALEAARRLSHPSSPDLYHARGQAHETIGELDLARADYEQAEEAARAAHADRAEWQSLIDLGFLWASRDYTKTGEYYQGALALAERLDDPPTLARTLNRIGNWHVNIEQPHTGLAYHQKALAIFQELGDRRGLAETLDLLGLASEEMGDMARSTHYYRQAIPLFRELDDRLGLASSLSMQTTAAESCFSQVCVPAPASAFDPIAAGDEATRLAREIGWRAGESYALGTLSYCLGFRGEYRAALESSEEALRIAEEIEHRLWRANAYSGQGWIYLDLLALNEARQTLTQALRLAQQAHSSVFVGFASAGLALACIQQNDLARAKAVLHEALNPELERFALADQTPVEAPPLSVAQRQCLLALAELELAQGRAPGALRVIERLIETTPNLTPDTVIPRLWLLRGEALVRLERWDEATRALENARTESDARGLRPLLWRIHAALGRLYRTQGEPLQAGRELSAAQRVVEELADGVPDEKLRAEFLKGASALLPRRRPDLQRRAP